MADSRSSFFGSISPWSGSRASTPPPKPKTPEPANQPALAPSAGLDHAISLRPSPSLHRYPRGCPSLKTRWYYAVDVAKRKPFAQEKSDEVAKPTAAPKKFVPFSSSDSAAIESAFQALDRGDQKTEDSDASDTTATKVPVNEDYLFDVHIEKRELEPAYWLGPVYEVRRGSWFYSEGGTLRPCEENLANQIEEGYLKIAPWQKASLVPPRSASQPRSRPTSGIFEGIGGSSKGSPLLKPSEPPQSVTPDPPATHRLFGSHMNTTVTYQDASTAFLSTDDFMSRMSSTVYGRFGGMAGTRVVRGYSDIGKLPPELSSTRGDLKSKGANLSAASEKQTEREPGEDATPAPPKRTALERQISSLAGLTRGGESAVADDEEDARQEEQQEMEAARETDGEEQGRKIDHLILVTHGIGQRLGLRLDSINFVHDVNTMRKTMKAVYASAPDLQALNESPTNCSIQVLPICWRHLLDFPRQNVRQNRKELDVADSDTAEDEYPSLQDITVEGIPYVRALTSDLVLDVLLYQSAYREHIASIVQKETNRVIELFKKRTGFIGSVSLCGHSLGSAILFDILCRQPEPTKSSAVRHRVSSKTARDAVPRQDLQLNFNCDSFFCLGSPIALFQMLKGRTVAARPSSVVQPPPMSPFDPDHMDNDPFSQNVELDERIPSSLLPITTSSPKCAQLYNVFHPTDPIAYRIEPLISPVMASLKPQQLPYTKKGLFAAPGIANISARVGQQVMNSWYSLTSGVASTLINRSLGITGEEQVLPQDKVRPTSGVGETVTLPVADGKKQQAVADAAKTDQEHVPTLLDTEIETLYTGFQKRKSSHGSNKSEEPSGIQYELDREKVKRLKREEAKVKALNSNGRVDYSIQEGMFDVSLLASIASHLGYWADEDVNHFIVSQVLRRAREGKEKKESGEE